MKCNKCGFDNQVNAEFCSNCGNKLNVPEVNSKKSYKKVFIILGITLVLGIGIFLIINKANTFKDPFDDIDDLTINNEQMIIPQQIGKENNSIASKLEKDYEQGSINADDYIMQFAYSLYEQDKLNNKYKNSDMDFSLISELYKKAEELQDELSDDTILYLFKKMTLSDVTLGDDESDNELGIANGLKSYKVDKLVKSENNVSKLDKVKLSSNNHFLIYYTNEGKNAITNETVNDIANYLEYTVDSYKKDYGYDFKYDLVHSGNSGVLFESALVRAKKLLKKNGIDDKYLETAMPVYIIDLENSGALGSYAQPMSWLLTTVASIFNVFMEDNVKIDIVTTTYAFPFFVVNAKFDNFDDMKLVASHELFHHYQNYICGNGEYVICPSGNFTTETTADLMTSYVSKVNKKGTVLNIHDLLYIQDVESSIDKVGEKIGGSAAIGYGAYIFGYNFSEIVPNGIKVMFNSVAYENPLKYIYDNSQEKYKDVFNAMAQKNLTLDYDNKVLIAIDDNESPLYPNNHADISPLDHKISDNIDYSSIHYYYIKPNSYNEKAQLTFSGNSKDLTLQLFVYDENKYQHLYTYTLDKEFTINISDFSSYFEVAFAIVNSEIEGSKQYSYEINNEGNKEPTVTASLLNLKNNRDEIENSKTINCVNTEDDEQYKIITQVKILFDKKDKIKDLFIKSTAQIKNYDPNNPAYKFAKNLVTTVINGIQLVYKETFKDYKLITKDEDDKYSITLKINKDVYKALNDGFSITYKDKYELIKEFESDNYYCTYE